MNDAHACSDTQENTVVGKNQHVGSSSTSTPRVAASRSALVICALEPHVGELEELEAQNQELQEQLEKFAVEAWSQESSAHRYFELHKAAVEEVNGLKRQLAAIADERALAQTKFDKDTEIRASECLVGFESLVQMFQDEELEDERVIAVVESAGRNKTHYATRARNRQL